MAVTQTQTLPAPFLEDITKQYAKGLGSLTAAPLDTSQFAPKVAGQDPLQTQAAALTSSGVGSYAPYITQAGAYDTAAAGLSGPSAYSAFMSPYQQSVIDTTLTEFDRQAAKGITNIADQAIASGGFGGGREGVQRAEYMAQSDRNRAALQAQLLGQAFGQAQQAASTAFGQQQSLAAQQQNLAQLAPQLAGQQIAGLSTLGAQQQAQEQAKLTAQQQLAQQQLNQPLQAAQQYGSGVTSLIAGYPGKDVITQQPGPSPVSTALGIGSTLAGIYRAFQPQQVKFVS